MSNGVKNLRFIGVVKIEMNIRRFDDGRFKGDYIVCEYKDDENVEYRKGFWFKGKSQEEMIESVKQY